ncbi:MAG: MBL fold metallo-hydrolase [archaeon]|jgi:L-ascorbate metabolism protein UlaG (beta-lactamase superfamily)
MGIKIKYLGHSSFIINMNGNNILTDPYFNNEDKCSYKRLIDCAIPFAKLPNIDAILISHEHFDAFDVDNTNLIAKKHKSKVIAHRSILNKVDIDDHSKISMDEYQTKTLNDINYYAYPAHHPNSFYPLSFLISDKKNSVYFAGDTLMTREHDKIKADIAMLPIGGGGTMDLGSAISVAKKIKPKYLIPMAYNTFAHMKQNPYALKEKLDGTRYTIKPIVIEPGKEWTYK